MTEPRIVLADTITKLGSDALGAVVVSGSHGGRYPGYLAAKAGVRAVILNDAGIGRDEAGIGSLPYLEDLGIAAVAIGAGSCTIGDTPDMMERGLVSRLNGPAAACGVLPGEPCREAARKLLPAPHRSVTPPPLGEARRALPLPPDARRRVMLLDSASLVLPEDAGQIVVTGSHGGLIGGNPALALRVEASSAVFSDAGRPDGPGTTRLPALDDRGIAACTVAAASARIGDAGSIHQDGIVSALNEAARVRGCRLGMPVRDWVARLVTAV